KSVDGARRVAKHAVDAHAELLVRIELIGSLEVLAVARRLLLLSDDPGLHLFELSHEICEVHHQIAHHGEVVQGFHADGTRQVVGQEGRARELRGAVHLHSAAAAYTHPARPPEGKGSVQAVLHVVERIQNHPVLPKWELIGLEGGFGFHFWPVARYGENDAGRHPSLTCRRPAYQAASG